MSRSVHTRPRRILAPDRVRAPYERRGATDPKLHHRIQRALKQRGFRAEEALPPSDEKWSASLPRISVSRVPGGWHHPASRADIARVLRFFGPQISYGLRSIELVAPAPDAQHRLELGTLLVPGRIMLYAQPLPPWTLIGTLSDQERQRLAREGAIIQVVGKGVQTVIDWPDDTLHDFMLFDVLMHEIGHHIVQHYTGKRRARVARSKDHEAFADLFARRCRQEYSGS